MTADTPPSGVVERLRSEAKRWTGSPFDRLCTEAADTITALLRERDAQAKVIEQLAKDAARYRHLREDNATEFGEPWVVTRYSSADEEPVSLHYARLDAAVDAARAGLNTQGSGNG